MSSFISKYIHLCTIGIRPRRFQRWLRASRRNFFLYIVISNAMYYSVRYCFKRAAEKMVVDADKAIVEHYSSI